jgi:long-chain fatty acid transport protein
MTRLKKSEFALAVPFINTSASFHNTGSQAATGQGAIALPGTAPIALGNNGQDAGGFAMLLTGYVALKLSDDVSFGVGLNEPFGLVTEWQRDWLGRFQATRSELRTYGIYPSLGVAVDKNWSLGGGLSFMKASAKLENAVNFLVPGLPAPLVGTSAGEGSATVKGSDTALGWNAALHFRSDDEATRVGINYRSKHDFALEGDVNFDRPTPSPALAAALGQTPAQLAAALAAATPNGKIRAELDLPDTLSLSIAHQATPSIDVLADITLTNWSTFKEIRIKRDSGATLASTVYDWDDTTRYAVGIHYRVNDDFLLRIGVAYDESPISVQELRTARLPDNNRTWASIGCRFALDGGSIDIGYSRVTVSDASLNTNVGGNNEASTAKFGLLKGTVEGKADVLAVQYNRSF